MVWAAFDIDNCVAMSGVSNDINMKDAKRDISRSNSDRRRATSPNRQRRHQTHRRRASNTSNVPVATSCSDSTFGTMQQCDHKKKEDNGGVANKSCGNQGGGVIASPPSHATTMKRRSHRMYRNERRSSSVRSLSLPRQEGEQTPGETGNGCGHSSVPVMQQQQESRHRSPSPIRCLQKNGERTKSKKSKSLNIEETSGGRLLPSSTAETATESNDVFHIIASAICTASGSPTNTKSNEGKKVKKSKSKSMSAVHPSSRRSSLSSSTTKVLSAVSTGTTKNEASSNLVPNPKIYDDSSPTQTLRKKTRTSSTMKSTKMKSKSFSSVHLGRRSSSSSSSSSTRNIVTITMDDYNCGDYEDKKSDVLYSATGHSSSSTNRASVATANAGQRSKRQEKPRKWSSFNATTARRAKQQQQQNCHHRSGSFGKSSYAPTSTASGRGATMPPTNGTANPALMMDKATLIRLLSSSPSLSPVSPPALSPAPRIMLPRRSSSPQKTTSTLSSSQRLSLSKQLSMKSISSLPFHNSIATTSTSSMTSSATATTNQRQRLHNSKNNNDDNGNMFHSSSFCDAFAIPCQEKDEQEDSTARINAIPFNSDNTNSLEQIKFDDEIDSNDDESIDLHDVFFAGSHRFFNECNKINHQNERDSSKQDDRTESSKSVNCNVRALSPSRSSSSSSLSLRPCHVAVPPSAEIVGTHTTRRQDHIDQEEEDAHEESSSSIWIAIDSNGNRRKSNVGITAASGSGKLWKEGENDNSTSNRGMLGLGRLDNSDPFLKIDTDDEINFGSADNDGEDGDSSVNNSDGIGDDEDSFECPFPTTQPLGCNRIGSATTNASTTTASSKHRRIGLRRYLEIQNESSNKNGTNKLPVSFSVDDSLGLQYYNGRATEEAMIHCEAASLASSTAAKNEAQPRTSGNLSKIDGKSPYEPGLNSTDEIKGASDCNLSTCCVKNIASSSDEPDGNVKLADRMLSLSASSRTASLKQQQRRLQALKNLTAVSSNTPQVMRQRKLKKAAAGSFEDSEVSNSTEETMSITENNEDDEQPFDDALVSLSQ